MKNFRSEQDFKDEFKDLTGFNWSDALGSFNTFQKCVRWADSHPNKSVQSWMDEVTYCANKKKGDNNNRGRNGYCRCIIS